ncbi:hypothetical protein ACM61V_16475 [Sphingomonas sp. TX0543]|uniref:hypothetical protein n=1 Tax=Sphingomonas sp. TX0543 TaxID=3399682 RepID=UPI003AFA1050
MASREMMQATVQKMFDMVRRPADGSDPIDADGVPTRLRNMAETVYAPEVQFAVPGRGPQAFSGGKQAYYDYNITRMQKTEGSQRLELLDMMFGNTHGAALIRYRDEKNGETFSWLRINLFRFNEAGDKIVDIKSFEHDQHGVDGWFTKALG